MTSGRQEMEGKRHSRPRLLDLFCGACTGGCAMGYHRAGFDVTGVDIKPQKHYPFEFHQADAFEFLAAHGHEFDVIHASPPCQKYSQVNRLQHLQERDYPDLIDATRDALIELGRPWIIENVEASPLTCAVRLCGSSFDLPIRRHRLFESSHILFAPPCNHHWQIRSPERYPTCFQTPGMPRRRSTVVQVYGNTSGSAIWPAAMGIDWMTRKEITQAIPPAYTEYLGRQLIRIVTNHRTERPA